ncbi:HAMP domain-containing protein [Sedimentibacter sp. zth1]|uniref:methyl-accepting chemotaxis protein n=1 Tax=Sedimentibacter sp. zth1 TaxID=2816908 RepID=UPI001A916F31|nr:methyl-accepting chemotaxis protein [Sedimentibacter sp. zth1]QSX05488.1 HAMP domain-containing protein [Sedimentibacter sp. zth1]
MFKNVKIGMRILYCFIFITLLVAGTMIITSIGTVTVANNLETFYEQSYNESNLAWSMKEKLSIAESNMYKCALYNEKSIVKENIQIINEQMANVNKISLKLKSTDVYKNSEKLIKFDEIIKESEPLSKQILEDLQSNMKTRALKVINEQYIPLITEANQILDDIVCSSNTSAIDFVENSRSFKNRQISILVLIVIIDILFIILTCITLTRSIVNPLSEIKNSIADMSKGKLNTKIKYNSKNEVGQLAKNVNATLEALSAYISNISDILGNVSKGNITDSVEMDYIGDFKPIKDSLIEIIDSLNTTLIKINETAQLVTDESEQVSSGSMALSEGTIQQASSIQELSASISEVANKVNKNAENAKEASKMSEKTVIEVKNGYDLMQNMMEAMEDIRLASDQIQSIIKVIDNIAFQTNILALNAAVEAARAGAAGKGFGVVAEEVRNLAAKSAESAKNTSLLIQNAIDAVEKGSQIAQNTSDSLKLIVESTKESTKLINCISEASNEQSNVISQINEGVEQISAIVQTNSSTAEENAASSEELSAQAQTLKMMVSIFELKTRNTEFEEESASELKKDDLISSLMD